MKRRVGKFQVHGATLRNMSDSGMAMIALQKDMGVVNMEVNPWADIWTFYAIGPMFDEIDEGEMAPLYECRVSQRDDGEFEVEFERLKDNWEQKCQF